MGICPRLMQFATSPIRLNCIVVNPFNISILSGRLAAPSLFKKSILRKAFDCGTHDIVIALCVYTSKILLYTRNSSLVYRVNRSKSIILHNNLG